MTAEMKRQWLLRCDKCHRVETCSTAEAFSYATKGWPMCCEQVMSFFVEMQPPMFGQSEPDNAKEAGLWG